MQVFADIPGLRWARWIEPLASWGLVPTMGFLHAGHLSLVHQARQENDRVGVSIFVNPAQFNNPNDFVGYPRDLNQDLTLLADEGVDIVWTPPSEVVYPPDYQTYVEVEQVTRPLEGMARPGHFRGVATVVAKLFNVFQPQRAYFGQKDAQQVVVIRRMVQDLNFNLDIVVCPTLREADGLAMSSRNVRLSAAARPHARCLYRALRAAQEACMAGQREAAHLCAIMRDIIETAAIARVDYVSVAHPDTLVELDWVADSALLSLAVFIGEVRLIDNLTVSVHGTAAQQP